MDEMSPETAQTFQAIADPANAEHFSVEAALLAFKNVEIEGWDD